ncbi:hypothetical protein Tco_0103140 [Tanacetum coccineum]
MQKSSWPFNSLGAQVEEEDNEPELIFPYVEADPLNLPPPASDSESEDVVEVEDMVEPEDETVPNSVHEVVRSSVEEGATALESLVRKFGNDEERAKCEKLRKELEDTRLSNTLLIRPNEAIDVLVKDDESPSSEPRGSHHDSYVDAAIADKRARHANDGNNARGSGLARGQVTTSIVRECTFSGFMKISECAEDKKVKFDAATLRGPLTWWNSKVVILGLDVANQIGTSEFCHAEELQRM